MPNSVTSNMPSKAEPLYPWQEAQFRQIIQVTQEDRLPHALLLCGPAQVGKAHFTRHLVQYLLCQAPADLACGSCDACLLIKAGTHPDSKRIGLVDSKQIKVEQIREIRDWETQTASQGGRMLCVIEPAEAMNHQAANALLKSLEEPTPDTLLILITHQPARLLPTIRSRCHRLELHLPAAQQASDWLATRLDLKADAEVLLEIASGSPLRVLNDIDDAFLQNRQCLAEALLPLARGKASPLQLATQLAKENAVQLLEILYSLIADSLQYSFGRDKVAIKNKDLQGILKEYSELVSPAQRFSVLDRIIQALGYLASTANANPQMLLERVLHNSVIPVTPE